MNLADQLVSALARIRTDSPAVPKSTSMQTCILTAEEDQATKAKPAKTTHQSQFNVIIKIYLYFIK